MRRALVTCTVSALAMSAIAQAIAQAPARLATPVSIEDPSGRALDAFHRALRRARDGAGRARITIWGASHVASDQYPGFLRAEWQRSFGDAGPGFVLPAAPFVLHAHQQVQVRGSGWRVVRVTGSRRRDAYGPAGIALEATGGARGEVRSARRIDRVALHFLRRPGGGAVELSIDGGTGRRVSTAGPALTPDVFELESPGRTVRVRALGDGPVRVFGLSLTRDTPGVIVDTLGVPGSRLRDRLPWDDAALQLDRLAPDLVVLAYGTNETGMRNRSIARYRTEADEAVRRVRARAPGASCLLIGPSDWPDRDASGAWIPRRRSTEVRDVQREVAARHGCAFFDLLALTGGPGSMLRWVDAGLGLGDHVHFTDEGHRVIARILSRALLRGL